DRRVEEPGAPGRRRRAAARLPGVEADVVVVPACRDKCRFGAEALHQLEAEHAAVEVERTLDVGDLEWTWPMSTPGSIGRGSTRSPSGIVERLVDELV